MIDDAQLMFIYFVRIVSYYVNICIRDHAIFITIFTVTKNAPFLYIYNITIIIVFMLYCMYCIIMYFIMCIYFVVHEQTTFCYVMEGLKK